MSTQHSTHDHHELMVSGGTVRCMTCMKWLHSHPDSRPVRGLVSKNQER